MSTEKSEILTLFSGRMKKWREDKGLTLQELADYIGFPYSTVREVENEKNVGYSIIVGIALKFPNDIHYLLTGEKPDSIHFTKGREEEERELMDIFRALPHKKQLNLLGMIRPDAIEIDDVAKPNDTARKKRPHKKTES